MKNNIMSVINSGRIFTVCFIKKDGSERVMNCRRKVFKYVTGRGKEIKLKKNLKRVYDLKKKGYRTINLKTLKWVRADKKEYRFENN